jgi:hypothetical protein
MLLTVKAILARCGFNREAAIGYCSYMAETYPQLAEEYRGLLDTIKRTEGHNAIHG